MIRTLEGGFMDSLIHAMGFKQALEAAKANRWKDAEEILKSLQEEYFALCEENRALKEQLTEVVEILDLSQSMRFDGRKYWLTTEDGEDGPFCQVCYDQAGTLVRLQEQKRHWQCKGCGNLFIKQGHPLEKAAATNRSRMPSQLVKNPIPLFVK